MPARITDLAASRLDLNAPHAKPEGVILGVEQFAHFEVRPELSLVAAVLGVHPASFIKATGFVIANATIEATGDADVIAVDLD